MALVASGCSGNESKPAAAAATKPASCPQSWKAGWQRLANRIHETVYCPTWMPPEVDAKIDGRFRNGRWVDDDKSYLVSFLWLDQDAGVSREVHVNFRGYPGRTTIPTCESTLSVKGKTIRKPIPCFSDPQPKKRRVGDVTRL